jgi:hypothetical protein
MALQKPRDMLIAGADRTQEHRANGGASGSCERVLDAPVAASHCGLASLELCYAVGIKSSTTLWTPSIVPRPAKPKGKMGRPPQNEAEDFSKL